MDCHFDWDPPKAVENERKHGVSFSRASTVFLDRRALSLFDAVHSVDEERWSSLGLNYTGSIALRWDGLAGSTDGRPRGAGANLSDFAMR